MIDGSTPIRGPGDLSAATIVAYFKGGKYPDDIVARFAAALVATCAKTGLRTSIIAAQVALETKRFKFGGQVAAGQFNLAGLAATDDGAAGLRFGTIEEGVRAVAAHHGAYLFGEPDRWPLAWMPIAHLAVRLRAVLGAGYGGTVAVLGDYGGGPWATDPDYAAKVAIHANALLALEATMTRPRVALLAGHHNTSGGNAYEYVTTGELVERTGPELARLGMDVRVITPDGADADTIPGDGDFPGALDTAAAVAVRWANEGWVPDALLEMHTQGVENTSVRGVFGIYPDAPGDLDTDARDRLIPLIVGKVCAAVGFPKYGDGRMSERKTGVGLDGFRLGVFRATAPLKASCTRVLVEYGAHSNPVEAKAHRTEAFLSGAARATAEAFAEFFGLPTQPDTGSVVEAPVAAPIGDERAELLSWANTLPLVARGNLTREGVADLSAYGGGREERIARYERLVAHRLKGSNYVLTLDLWDDLRKAGKVVLY